MVDIWAYANKKPRIRIVPAEGGEYIGDILAVLDAEELETGQDCIDIELDSGEIISFRANEIESIEVLND